MLILINGLPLFSKKLAEDLNKSDKHKYIFLDTYYKRMDLLKFFVLLPFAKVFISFNGVSDKSGTLDWVIKMKKRLIMFWHGTDAVLAKGRFENGTINKTYIDYASHFSDAPWLKEELKLLIPEMKIANFKTFEIKKMVEPFKKVQILSYIGKGKESFYGLPWILEASEMFPNIDFHIVGVDGPKDKKMSNVKFHGWVDSGKMNKLYAESPIF